MDAKYNLNYRKSRLRMYENTGDKRYNYAKNGLLIKCFPKILFKGNPLLTTFLQIIETRLIMVMKYIDRVKEFKYISRYI